MIKKLLRTILPNGLRYHIRPYILSVIEAVQRPLTSFALWFDGTKFDNVVVDSWRPCFRNSSRFAEMSGQSVEEMFRDLKEGLDAQSRRELDRYLQRVTFAVLGGEMKIYCSNRQWARVFDDDETCHISQVSQCHSSFTLDGPLANVWIDTLFDGGLFFCPPSVIEGLAGKDFIDGGAFIGDSLPPLLKYSPSRIYSFEPSAANYKYLCKNVTSMEWQDRVVPLCKGLGDRSGSVPFDETNESGSRVLADANETDPSSKRIDILTIDDFVSEKGLVPGLIKLDVEGFEWNVIAGAAETIRQFKPVLLISIYHTPKDFFMIKPFIERMNLGYHFAIRKLNPSHPFAELVLIGYATDR